MVGTLFAESRRWIGMVLLGGVVVGITPPTSADTVVFSDGQFFEVAWDTYSDVGDPPDDGVVAPMMGSGSIARGPTSIFFSGNPGFFQQHTKVLFFGDIVATSAINSAQTYDPSVQGPIENFAVEYDFKLFGITFGRAIGRTSLGIFSGSSLKLRVTRFSASTA